MSDLDDELFALAGGDEDVDVEEGEASSVAASSPNSLGSDAMDESDSEREDDTSAKEISTLYPLEGKFIDAKDRSRILSLPEIERETILGQRQEEISGHQFRAELARRAKASEKTNAASDKKRKASSLEPEDAQRKSSRQKVKTRTNDNLEAYKQKRKERDQQLQRMDERRSGRRHSSSPERGVESDLDAEGESEPDWDEQERVKQAARDEQPAQLMHFEAVRVGRGFFSKVCFYPGFEDAMVGTFARVGTGQDAQKRTLYKMAQIKGFISGKPYVFEGKDGQRLATDQYVVTQYGSTKKEYNFTFLSNGRFTEADLDSYRQSLLESNSRFPTEKTLKRKFDDIKKLENRFWTDADITDRIKKQNKFSHILSRGSGDNPAPRIATQAELESRRIAELNKKNRMLDSERVRKAQIEDYHRTLKEKKQREREWQAKKAAEEAKKRAEEEKAKKKAEADDLFDGDSRTGTPRSGTPKPGEKKKEPKKGLPTFRKPKMDDDIIASMDIGIDIEI
ncbi:hypothetical protein BU24DRAFT_416580 [Aaosphaeria arxii CBS 175.79]|uniref:Plus3 domain-containing protein n=1 Tax=Aaosphaeria arxii CBS 175.79 TaxID=1450172 RepID=A0A6A5Y7B1_9PLEO|nr:uncharacterized protein BU24DRAFT_416580 [Aaosphaeria arxii CBS 175.79]KAF2020917.1 hypothetical protein BU24DRAFT_416580 [Aaosphaeria arxii CBS 175.79]